MYISFNEIPRLTQSFVTCCITFIHVGLRRYHFLPFAVRLINSFFGQTVGKIYMTHSQKKEPFGYDRFLFVNLDIFPNKEYFYTLFERNATKKCC